MNRILILGDSSHWHTGQLLQASPNPSQTTIHSFDSLSACIVGSQPKVHIDGSRVVPGDWIIVRQMPRGTLQQIIFRMNALQIADDLGAVVINSPKSLELSIDKFLSLARLAQDGLPVIDTAITQTQNDSQPLGIDLGSSPVVKPIFGGRGVGVERLNDGQFEEKAKNILEKEGVLLQQQFVNHPGWDVRVLMIGEELLSVKRSHPNDWRTNINLGGIASRYEPSTSEKNLCKKVKKTIDADILAIDLIYDDRGNCYVLEANGVPGWKGLQSCLEIDVSQLIFQFLMKKYQ